MKRCYKIRFESPAAAKRSAKAAKRRHGKATPQLFAYRCGQCAAWHLTKREAFVLATGIQFSLRVS
jgi:hypothetical protein